MNTLDKSRLSRLIYAAFSELGIATEKADDLELSNDTEEEQKELLNGIRANVEQATNYLNELHRTLKICSHQRFRVHWQDGKTTDVVGSTIAEALNNSGYGAGSVPAIDYYEPIND